MNAMMMFSKVLGDTYSNEIERQASVVAWKCVPGVRAAWYAPRGRESHLDHQLIGKGARRIERYWPSVPSAITLARASSWHWLCVWFRSSVSLIHQGCASISIHVSVSEHTDEVLNSLRFVRLACQCSAVQLGVEKASLLQVHDLHLGGVISQYSGGETTTQLWSILWFSSKITLSTKKNLLRYFDLRHS